ncbi:MAG: TAT-variant-translocated molybdopterin oxidoreductase [Bacteroidetes bacterium]|nr:TAT-variant-translocated molybdopterin oxidoreductase [Bacteroidota bacterium]
MSQNKYWKGIEELENTPAYQKSVADEFPAELPFSDVSEGMLSATTPRRDFLKYLGFSTAAAMLAASCEMPVRKAITYAIKPDEIMPGVPNWYASSFVDGGDYCAILVKTREGRPIKIEGNELSSITRGGTSARVQASVLSLYDNARIRQPYADGKPVDMFEKIDREVMAGLSSGKPAVLLTATLLSPTVKAVIDQFIAKYPTARHIVFDPISYSGMLLANEASYGKRALPSYHFDKAKTIVSIGADFLGTWLSPVEFAKGYAAGRKMSAQKLEMSRHYQFEGLHSLTGANADVRATCKPSEYGAVAVALYNAVMAGTAPSFASKKLNDSIVKAAEDLKKGNGMVVCGSNDVQVQTVVNAINAAINANGTTINWAVNSNYKQGIDADMVNLVAAMKAGQVGTLIMHGVNPAYEYYDGAAFTEALKSVPVSLSMSDHLDETATASKFILPDHHFLESWGDAEPKTGYFSLMQPSIAPLFKTRSLADSLLTWAGATTTYADFWKDYWLKKLGSQSAFDQALQDGVVEPGLTNFSSSLIPTAGALRAATPNDTAVIRSTVPAVRLEMTMSGASFAGNVSAAIAGIAGMKSSGSELALYEKVAIGRGGSWSNNPWMLEMPDPITKATWDNYVCISPAMAKKLDAGDLDMELTTHNEINHSRRVIRLTVNGKSLELPTVVVPGMHNDVVAVALGYGRVKSIGRAGGEVGKNAYPFMTWNGTTFGMAQGDVKIEKTDKRYDIAQTQTHHSYEGRAIIHEYTLDDFSKNPKELLEDRFGEFHHFAHLPWEDHGDGAAQKAALIAAGMSEVGAEAASFEAAYRKNGTLYGVYDSPGIHWGMSIDLNSCIGCGACVIGCQSENNVAVVGKSKVLMAQEMFWMNIDRYFAGNPDDPDTIQTVFQPMLCQHCDNAPCENVCPVSATNHSSEGLNQMAYNRCIGTKYCANNCPYKVRRFNWMDWDDADCFADNLYEDGHRETMDENLTRMVLNPDVVVRSRGVMEKCSFCVQRLQDAKLVAKKAGRPMQDGEAKTACQTACPTDAIVFGNVNDKSSAIFGMRYRDQPERTYYVLEELHTMANVSYLSKVRNNDLIVAGKPETDIIMDKSI